MIVLLLIVGIALGLFYVILNIPDIPGIWKFFLVVIEMIIVSQILIKRYNLPTELGLVLLKSKKGIETIDKIAKHNTNIFNFLSDTGNAMAYGLLSLAIMKRKSPAALICGLFLLFFVSIIVGYEAFDVLFEIINMGGIEPVVILTNLVNATAVLPNGSNITITDSENVTIYYANATEVPPDDSNITDSEIVNTHHANETLAIDQTAAQLSPGGIVEFNITATNTGNTNLDITVWNSLPAGLTFASSDPAPSNDSFIQPRTSGWNFNLSPGESRTIQVNATVDPELARESMGSFSRLGLMGVGAILLLLLVGGLFAFLLFGLILYGAIIANEIFNSILYGVEVTASPGGTVLLPGVNLPLFEGIIALIVVLVVHEGAHAILARIGKVPLLSSGIVLFGIIPIGAFVEPDEKKLAELDEEKQTRVLVAGSTSNLMSSVVFFFAYIIFKFVSEGLGLMQIQGSWALNIGGMAFDLVLAPFGFIQTTLGLIFALNFIVGTVNLLPLPLFDGYRIIEVNIKNDYIVKALMYITLLFFIVNFLPHFFGG